MSDAPTTSQPLPEWERRFFNLGKGATIVLIGLIVLALAGAGLLAGALLSQTSTGEHAGPEGKTASGASLHLGSAATRATTTAFDFRKALAQPSPVGSSAAPVQSSTPPSPGPTPSGHGVAIGPNGAVTAAVGSRLRDLQRW